MSMGLRSINSIEKFLEGLAFRREGGSSTAVISQVRIGITSVENRHSVSVLRQSDISRRG
jgi:hypothetical protein